MVWKIKYFFSLNYKFKLQVFIATQGVGTHHKKLKSQQRPARRVVVYKIQVNPIHTILKYGIYYGFMDSAVLKSSSPWQLKEC